MTRNLVPLTVVALAACTPNNAELISGRYEAYIGVNTSTISFSETVDFEGSPEHFNLDCRDLADESDRLPDAIDACDGQFLYEVWATRDAFRAMAGPIEPWRGEAVITGEGDFQITFHHRLPGGEDFRFAIVVDPIFQPLQCVEHEDGTLSAEPIDGDWLENWSADVDDGTLYYLNAGAYQFATSDQPTPIEDVDIWSLPQEWRAGYAIGNFAGEDLFFRRPMYAPPNYYTASDDGEGGLTISDDDIYYVGVDATDNQYARMIADVEDDADRVETELGRVRSEMITRVHTNEWRPRDAAKAGLDGWGELHTAWIRFDDSSDLSPGGSARGDFQVLFGAGDSQTRVFVSGEFNVDRIKKDRWVTDDLNEIKLEEAGTELCVPRD